MLNTTRNQRSKPNSAMLTVAALLLHAASVAAATGGPAACNSSGPTTPNLEWSGPSLQHGLVGDGSAAACAEWCCATTGCTGWSLLVDVDCYLKPGQRCCMGWPAGRTLSVRHDDPQRCVSGRVDGGPLPPQWPEHPTWEPTWDMAMSTAMMPCNTSGWFDPALAAQYGLADFVRLSSSPVAVSALCQTQF